MIQAGALALGACLLAGCTTSGGDMSSSLAPTSGFSYAGEADVALPDSTEIVPSSFAGPSPPGRESLAMALPIEDAAQASAIPDAPPTMAAVEPRTVGGKTTSSSELDTLIRRYAELYDVPEALVRSVVKRESNFRPHAYNRGHWGLMQIKHATARGMGYSGPARGLLDAETNLKFAVKYLRGAWIVAQGDAKRADRLYQRGYYYDAKRMGLLEETGLGKDRRRRSRS